MELSFSSLRRKWTSSCLCTILQLHVWERQALTVNMAKSSLDAFMVESNRSLEVSKNLSGISVASMDECLGCRYLSGCFSAEKEMVSIVVAEE